jgi:Ca2+-binding RTX toxin-like protein
MGDDSLIGGGGADFLSGGGGADRFSQAADSTALAGAASTAGTAAVNEFRDGETVVGAFDRIIAYNIAEDRLTNTGAAGATVLTGANGAGSTVGAAGNFVIRGTYNPNNSTFIADISGNDVFFFRATAALGLDAFDVNGGTQNTVIQGTLLGQNIAGFAATILS